MLIALVDYDNIKSIRPDKVDADVRYNLEDITECISGHTRRQSGETELVLRLYGGWTHRDGRYTPLAEMLARAVNDIRGLRNGIRVLPEIATSLAAARGHTLRGLLRRNSGVAEQKMVDSVLCCDTVHFSTRAPVVVVSDDDDVMVGGLAAASGATFPIHLLRRRAVGSGLNDSACELSKVRIFKIS